MGRFEKKQEEKSVDFNKLKEELYDEIEKVIDQQKYEELYDRVIIDVLEDLINELE